MVMMDGFVVVDVNLSFPWLLNSLSVRYAQTISYTLILCLGYIEQPTRLFGLSVLSSIWIEVAMRVATPLCGQRRVGVEGQTARCPCTCSSRGVRHVAGQTARNHAKQRRLGVDTIRTEGLSASSSLDAFEYVF